MRTVTIVILLYQHLFIMAEQEVVFKPLHVPPLEEVAQVFRAALEETFKCACVSVVECPDLTQEPFLLSAPGLSGSQRLADVGGIEYQIPTVRNDKIYNFRTIGEQIGLPDAFIIGAGAGSRRMVGANCELMPNVNLGKYVDNSYVAIVAKDGSCDLRKWPHAEMSMVGNLFASKGQKGPVLKVVASHRTSSDNFVSILRNALVKRYGDKPVGVGGTFLIRKGNASLHIMETSATLKLKVYNFSAPFTCLSTFISSDPGLELRLEHAHCFSNHGEGGHYREDTSPEDVEYEAYYNLAEFIYRIDRPPGNH